MTGRGPVRAALALSCLACMGATILSAQPASAPRTIARGAHSNVDNPLQAVARTPAEWSGLWRKHDAGQPPPAVDFSREMAVAVFMGSRPSAGFSVEIVSAAGRDGRLVVIYRETAPAPGMVTAQILTSPFHMAAIPRSAAPVVFEAEKH